MRQYELYTKDQLFFHVKQSLSHALYKAFVFLLMSCMLAGASYVSAQEKSSYISNHKEEGYFTLSEEGMPVPVLVDSGDHAGVLRVLGYLRSDIQAVTGATPLMLEAPQGSEIVIVGTIGRSKVIDKMVSSGKLDVKGIQGKWESYLIEVVEKPFPDVERALVIAGSDKRGTIYGIFDLSKNIGVSPWYWWADVPPVKNKSLYVVPGKYAFGEPAVKYRGIFLNDELPALENWARETYGDLNHEFYEKVFELILRLRGNYLWPAMWNGKFNVDDPLNPVLADEMGIVMSTTHHEPMMKAHKEWGQYGGGAWNYETNEESLRTFWTEGIDRMGTHESIVSLGMRGDGDKAMSRESNIALLEKIIQDQREIIEEVTGKDPSETPQLWALYKEVQDYYDRGMRVPEDITLLLCDDNWGNVRKLPKPGDKPRSGGYGMYYHFDFVGGPRNYKWLNTSPLSRVWEQMHLCYEYGVDRIWLVNVGDLKPMELPISFFLDYAWDPDEWAAASIPEYHYQWAKQQFGEEHAKDIADILMSYTKYNGRRKPEMIAPETYSLIHYREAEHVMEDYNRLAAKAEKIYELVSAEQKDAYYQLVLFPVVACANLNELHITTGKNHLYAKQGRVKANHLAKRVEKLFAIDTVLRNYFHTTLSDGKWNHMMSQNHISYTYWQQPDQDVVPKLEKVIPLTKADMGIAIEGSYNWWPMEKEPAILPEFDSYKQQKHYIELFNRGTIPFDFHIKTGEPWIKTSTSEGSVDVQERIWLEVDWDKAPHGKYRVSIDIAGPDTTMVMVYADVRNPESPKRDEISGHIEGNGYVSIEAINYTRAAETDQIHWQVIPDLGRTGSAITTFPLNSSPQSPQGKSPYLEYRVHLYDTGMVNVMVYLAPTLNYTSGEGLKYAISLDDEEPQIVNMHAADTIPDWTYPEWWNNAVTQNIRVLISEHRINKPGEHTLKYWMIDPGIVLEKIVLDAGGVKPSYLGPPESFYQKDKLSRFYSKKHLYD